LRPSLFDFADRQNRRDEDTNDAAFKNMALANGSAQHEPVRNESTCAK